MILKKSLSLPDFFLSGPTMVSYSRGQITVFDAEGVSGFEWKEAHWWQGFIRRPLGVSFATLKTSGSARLSILPESEGHLNVSRVIRTTLYFPSGQAKVQGPDEGNVSRYVKLSGPGIYRITAAQMLDYEDQLHFFLSFRQVEAIEPTQILKADNLLRVPSRLLE